jgi:hypothetical protein
VLVAWKAHSTAHHTVLLRGYLNRTYVTHHVSSFHPRLDSLISPLQSMHLPSPPAVVREFPDGMAGVFTVSLGKGSPEDHPRIISGINAGNKPQIAKLPCDRADILHLSCPSLRN